MDSESCNVKTESKRDLEFTEFNRCGYSEGNGSRPDRVHFASSYGRSIRKGHLRFKMFYDKRTVEPLPADKKNRVKYVVQEATKFWSEALVVNQLSEPIRLHRSCVGWKGIIPAKPFPLPCCKDGCLRETKCGEMLVPEEHLGPCRICPRRQMEGRLNPGVRDADTVLYISAKASYGCSGGAAAHAIACAQEDKLDRPIAGGVNLCPNHISDDIAALVATVKHEILHVLGFSRFLFGFFRNKTGEPLVKRSNFGLPMEIPGAHNYVYKKVTRKWKIRGNRVINRDSLLLVTPRVVKEVRSHFNCPDLEGAELEDQGGEGTRVCHWEKRVFLEEGMTGMGTHPYKFTRMTFALLEDTGWYEPNYNLASTSQWGKGLGCDFAMKSCKQWMDIQKAKDEDVWPFCNTIGETLKCTYDRNSIGICPLIKFQQKLPDIYQHFDQIRGISSDQAPFYGLKNSLADHCPSVRETLMNHRPLRCGLEGNEPKDNHYLEDYGQGSKCFEFGEEKWANRKIYQGGMETATFGETAGCYKFTCSGGRINIKILNKDYPCFYKNQVIPIRIRMDVVLYISGSIVCPACEELCEKCAKDDKEAAAKHNYQNVDIEAVMKGFNFYRSLKSGNTTEQTDHSTDQGYSNGTSTEATVSTVKPGRERTSRARSKFKSTLDRFLGSVEKIISTSNRTLRTFSVREKMKRRNFKIY